jgi:hypothetical protein
MKGALVVCARVPLPGTVKTSLHPHLTDSQSATLYGRFLADTCEITQDVEGVDFFLAYSPEDDADAFKGIVPPPFRLFSQAEAEMGHRLAGIFERLMQEGYERVLVLKSDSPDLPICLLNQASDILASGRAEMVYGPSERDGFYLVGLRRWHRELFHDVDWDTPQLSSRVLRQARKLGMRVRRLPEWYEIDTVEDLRRHLTYYSLRRRSGSAPECQCRTGEYLFEIQDRILPRPAE